MTPEEQRDALIKGEQAGRTYRLVPPRKALRGAAGFHAGSAQGVSLDFSDYREYHPGDDIRSLDWNVFARTDKLTVKLFHEEVAPHVDILLDASRSMGLGGDKPRALLGLGALFATASAGSDCSWNCFQLSGQLLPVEQGNDIPSVWGPIKLCAERNPGAALRVESGRLRRQSIRILISDLLWEEEPLAVLRRLSENASALIVVQVLGKEDVEPLEGGRFRLDDAETGASVEVVIDADMQRKYREALELHTRSWADACRQTSTQFGRIVAEEAEEGWKLDDLLLQGILEPLGGRLC